MRIRGGIVFGLALLLGGVGARTSGALADSEQCVIGNSSLPDACIQERREEDTYQGHVYGTHDHTTYAVGTSEGDHRDIAYFDQSCDAGAFSSPSMSYTISVAGQSQYFWPAIPLPTFYGTNYITLGCTPR